MKQNLIITMSGGTTTVINATLAGIIKAAKKCSEIDRIYAGYPGIIGMLTENILDLTDVTDNELERIYYTPASGLIGTTRVRPLDTSELIKLSEVFEKLNIGYFLNIGGNGTIKQTVQISDFLSNEFRCAALPKTVDNDLGDMEFEKVLFTPGFPSCANYWQHKVHIMNQENLGAHSHDKILIAQTFGRKTGFLAACARLGDTKRELPLIILLPEDQQGLDSVLNKIELTVKKFDRAIIVLSEGYDIDKIGERHDLSGQIMYSSSKETAAQLLVNHCTDQGFQARAFIPGFDQRSDILFTTAEDLQHSYNLGCFSVQRLFSGERNFLASISKNKMSKSIEYTTIPFSETKNYSRILPESWVAKGGFDVTDSFIEYAEPIIGKSILSNFVNPFKIPFIEKNRSCIKHYKKI
ncbi:MAG: 6-phosphofructokinase [Candidatus Gastranaerophilales bacterium]|nr:6-phosphofructokinase [Candidatus Gastranaerophilales bacterium]